MRKMKYHLNLNYIDIFLNNMIHITGYLYNLRNLVNIQDMSYNKFLQHCIQYMMYKQTTNMYYNLKNILIYKYCFKPHNMWDNQGHIHSNKHTLSNKYKLHLQEFLVNMLNINQHWVQNKLNRNDRNLKFILLSSLLKLVLIHFQQHKSIGRRFLRIKLKDWNFND